MPKWKLFLWKIWHNGIATKANLHLREITNSSECPICLHDQEDVNHLFRFCPLALEAWDQGTLRVHINNMVHMSFTDWLSYWVDRLLYTEDRNSGSCLPTYIGTIWAIWKLRNSQVFRQQRPTVNLITPELQESMCQHGIFTHNSYDPTRKPLDPSTPPEFHVAHIGQQIHGIPSITFQIAGTRNKTFRTCNVVKVSCSGVEQAYQIACCELRYHRVRT